MFSPIGSWNFVLGIWFLVLRSSPGGLWIMRSCWTSRSIILWALAAPCICLARAHTPPCSLCSPWFDCWPRGTRGPRGPTIQNPYDHLPIPDIGLKPLLRSADGKTINTKQAWEEQRRLLRVAWLKRLGEPPTKPKTLNIQAESREIEPDHIRQLVSFVSEGDDRIRAYLLLPKGLKENEKRPAVVVFHQTTKLTLREPVGLGKRPDLALALELVRRGYITLSPECFIMKETDPKLSRPATPYPATRQGEQAQKLAQRRPSWTGLGKTTFDASRCVDYLETLSQVDHSRITCIGHSLGAKEVLYAMAFEPRFQAGVFNEGGIGLRMSNWFDPWYLTETMKQHVPVLEHHQLMALIAPRPFLVMGGNSADGDASWAFVKEARSVYELLGAKDRIGLYNSPRRVAI